MNSVWTEALLFSHHSFSDTVWAWISSIFVLRSVFAAISFADWNIVCPQFGASAFAYYPSVFTPLPHRYQRQNVPPWRHPLIPPPSLSQHARISATNHLPHFLVAAMLHMLASRFWLEQCDGCLLLLVGEGRRGLPIRVLRVFSSRQRTLARSGGVRGICYVEDVVRTMAQVLRIVLCRISEVFKREDPDATHMLIFSCRRRRMWRVIPQVLSSRRLGVLKKISWSSWNTSQGRLWF